jgi:hypothetical protein
MNFKIAAITLFTLFSILPSTGCRKKKKTRPVKKIIPLTVANMKGHKMVYNEGWYIVSSTKGALNYAHRVGLISSGEAIKQAAQSVVKSGKNYGKDVKGDLKKSYNSAVTFLKMGTQGTKAIFAGTHVGAKSTFKLGTAGFSLAWKRFLKGNLSLAKRTKDDRNELDSIPGKFFTNLKEDFSNLFALTLFFNKEISKAISLSWAASFKQAREEFNIEYEKSGKKENAILALVNIFAGYGKALYYAVVKPSVKTAAKGTLVVANYGLFLPTAATTLLAGRTVQVTGLTFYYTTKLGIKLVSPTIEGGVLTALSMLAMATIPVQYVAGSTAGVVNQLAITALAPAYGTTRAAVTVTADTVKHAAMVVYAIGKGTTKVFINQVATGLVLGYNALLAIPAHLYLGTIDTAIFLAWDGPRLVIAAVTGGIGAEKNKKISMGSLPVGSVIDLKKLEKERGVKVKIISRDPKIIKNVLKSIPKDSRPPQKKPETKKEEK